MSSRFFKAVSDSESESSEGETEAVQQRPAGAGIGASAYSFSDDEEEAKRQVKSAKDEHSEQLHELIRSIKNGSLVDDNYAKESRAKLMSWLGKTFRIVITDKRLIVGCFVCTDRDANVILDSSLEYTDVSDENSEPRVLGLALIPGQHIVQIEVENY